MKLFVTGGAGFIGSNFIRHVLGLAKSYAVVNYDKLTYAGNLANLDPVASNPNYQFVKGDICDAAAVEASMRGCGAVIHFAAESHVDRSIYEPTAAIETNVKGTFMLLQVARKLGVERFVHISTDEVYGDIAAGAFADENSPLQPSSPYSSSKAGSDLLVRSYVRTYGFPALITRSSNNYGPYQFPEKFLPLLITNALDNKPLPIYGDGKQQRDWLHVEDNCRGILAVLERGRIGEVYNIGGSDIEENLTMAHRLLRVMNKPESLLSYVQDRPGHDRRYALRCHKIEKELGWKPAISLELGLHQTVDWYRTNVEWLAGVRGGDYRSYYAKYYENRDSSLHSLAQPEAAGSK
ncbi:MAG TPA: dTDP-glucose 4,6-dehydratase [Candidatus Acidoferrales bacterium]|nr:dTDP-glucose 4,6-dehydratase [Candidatus Acidoferrales bacterium]